MAGGANETPRQRMIGMMYLVLTALLALQVSNAVLDKFVFIDKALQQSTEVTVNTNQKIFDGISNAVTEGGSRPRDVAVLDKAKIVRDRTNEIMNELEDVRRGLTEFTGGIDPETGRLKAEKDYDKLMLYMIGNTAEGTKGRGYELADKLNAYVDELKTITDDSVEIERIARPASEMEQFKDDPDQKKKDWVQLNFDHTPTVAAMAIISEFEQEVAQKQGTAMEYLAKKVGADIPKFDKIIAVATAESNVVAAGTKYSAQMFLAASSSTARPAMSVSGAPGGVKMNSEGVGSN